jgi:glycine cleavage system aminomethyltransferase T/glycine/D-amino acid oxidase-like deaminating enzyme
MRDLPPEARVVVIGGGAVGCSTAYHLTKLGWSDVVVLEQHTLSAGSTWHAAGAVAQYRPNANLMALAKYSVDLYQGLEKETGLSTGLRQCGGMRVTTSRERRAEYERAITTARSFGLEMHLISPREAKELFPIMEVEDLDSAIYVPTDGVVGPSDVTQALSRGARTGGARFFERVTVTGFEVHDGRISAVETSEGTIRCEAAAICCGIWSRGVGRLAGVNVPIWPSRHCYFVTEPFSELDPNWATSRDPDLWHYFVPTGSGLIVGQYEPDPVPWDSASIPRGWSFRLLPEDRQHFTRLFTPLAKRVPLLDEVGVQKWFHGLESFTEDQNPVVGEAPEVGRLFVAAGFNAYGVSVAGGFGMALAEWIVKGLPPYDLWPSDIRRFSSAHRSDETVRVRAVGGQGRHYAIHFPFEEITEGRPLRRSPLYDRLAAERAVFGEKAGWERPNWFAPDGVEPVERYSFRRQQWHEYAGAEHRACREAAAVFDLSSFSKLRVVGRDAEGLLQRLCTADLSMATGRVAHTLVLNEAGGIEADLTVARLASDDYLVITGSAFATHDFGILRDAVASGEHVSFVDVTSAFAALAVMGPRSRELLQTIAESDLSAEAFPFRGAQEIVLGRAPVLALRVSYAGELGFELYIPAEYALAVYEAIAAVGQPFGLRNAGYRALDSLRLEKANKAWAADIGPDYSPLEAGLAYALAFGKDVAFGGRDALLAQRERPLTKRLMTFTVDEADVVLTGREGIYRDGEPVGWLTSGGFGHTIQSPIGLGYVRNRDGVSDDYLASGDWELEVATRRIPTTLTAGAVYDPSGARMRG